MMLIHTSQLCDTNSFAYRSCNGIRGRLGIHLTPVIFGEAFRMCHFAATPWTR